MTSPYTTNNVNEMNIDRLLYTFQQRMRVLIKAEQGKHMMDAYAGGFLDIIENEIMPNVDHIVDWEPSDDEITASNSVGTPWHDGCWTPFAPGSYYS